MPAQQQVTPETAPTLVDALWQLANRGSIQVAHEGMLGRIVITGKLTCQIMDYEKGSVVESRIRSARMPTPIQPRGFTPNRVGECVAYFEVVDNKVCVRHLDWRKKIGWRHFELV